jgi:hypothetical protein
LPLSHAAKLNEPNNTIAKIAAAFFMTISLYKSYEDRSLAKVFMKDHELSCYIYDSCMYYLI